MSGARNPRSRAAMTKLIRSVLAPVAAALTLCCAEAGEAHPDSARMYAAATEQVLVERHVCADVQDCRRKELVFWEGGNPWLRSHDMVYVLLYETNDRAVYDSVLARLAQLRAASAMPPVKLVAYKSRHLKRKVKFAEAMLK